MAQFTLPINWQDDYFDKIDFSGVCEVYGKLREDYPGGGKSSMAQGDPSRAEVKRAVQEVHRRGMTFNYLVNTTCIDNRELTAGGQRQIRKLFDWLSEIGVDRVTVALPFLAEMLKRHNPGLSVGVSTQAAVNSLEKVQHWQDLGADAITLSHVEMNRDFKELKRISANSSLELQLIGNMICKRGCPFVTLHGNFNAHASQSWAPTNRFNLDYYFIACLANAFSDPLTIIKANWIRPEDVPFYEGLGIKRIKLAERGLTSDALARIVAAYRAGSYEGNLADLLPSFDKYVFAQPGQFRRTMKELFRLPFVNLWQMWKSVKQVDSLRKSPHYARSQGVHIENRALDGLIEAMAKRDCLSTTCKDCGICPAYVAKACRILDPVRHAQDLQVLRSVKDSLVSGEMFTF